MKNNSSSLILSILVICVVCFVMSKTSTQNRVLKSFETFFDLKEGSLVRSWNAIESNETNGSQNSVSFENCTDEEKSYYSEICLGTEDGQTYSKAFKWKRNIKIYVSGEKRDYMMDELDNIVSDLNDLIDPIELEVVSDKSEANTFIYMGGPVDCSNTFTELSLSELQNVRGYFEIRTTHSTMFVDLERTEDNIEFQKHILREELTQSLGLCNDSWKYEESIFYQGYSTVTEYSELDKKVIQMLYNN